MPSGGPDAGVLLVITLFIVAILASLALALRHLFKDREQSSSKMIRFLTIRIALSVALFAFLILAWWLGWIQPHGLAPAG